MAWQATLYSVLGAVAAVLSVSVAARAYQNRAAPGVQSFVGLMITLAGWSLASAIQLGFTTLADQLLWQRVGLAVGAVIPTLWLLFALEYAGRTDWLTRRRQAILAVEPAVFALVSLTNPLHGILWQEATLVISAGQPATLVDLGIGYYLHIGYAYLLVAVGIALIAGVAVRSAALYRRQASVLIVGAVPPFLANIGFTLRLVIGPLPEVDLTPFAFVATGVLFGLAMFQFDLLDREPVARQRALEGMGDGLVILDADGVIIDLNRVAREVLDPVPEIGTRVHDLSSVTAETASEALGDLRGRTFTGMTEGRRRAYDVEVSELTDSRGREVGYAIVLRDVTDREAHERRLDVTQRVLRHNLRNDMNVVRGWAEQLNQNATNGRSEAATRIRETATELIDLTDKTRQLVAVDEYDMTEPIQVDISQTVETVVAEFQRSHPHATIACDIPADLRLKLPAEAPLRIALANLVENAIEHNDTAEPQVTVRVGETGDGVKVHVADDGPGIPAIEREVLKTGTETSLEHGSGVGLWLAYWSVATLGGEIDFTERKPRGSVVTLRLPATKDVPRASI